MPVIHIPASLRRYTDEVDRFTVEGATLRQAFRSLREQCPKVVDQILEGDQLRPDIAVAIDGTIHDGSGLVTAVSEDTEIFLVPPLGGG